MTEHSRNDEPPMNDQDFRLTAYEQCFAEKHHYDNLSWTIGAVLLVFVGALLAYIPQIKPTLGPNETFGIRELLSEFPCSVASPAYLSMVVPRAILALFAWSLLLLWFLIYSRNRIWAEIANQKIRGFERDFGVEGIGIRFAKENANIIQSKRIMLVNTDEKGNTIPGYQTNEQKTRVPSMHKVIPYFIGVVLILAVLASILP